MSTGIDAQLIVSTAQAVLAKRKETGRHQCEYLLDGNVVIKSTRSATTVEIEVKELSEPLKPQTADYIQAELRKLGLVVQIVTSGRHVLTKPSGTTVGYSWHFHGSKS